MGEKAKEALRVKFDKRLRLEFFRVESHFWVAKPVFWVPKLNSRDAGLARGF